jgi:lysyl-tRNA synthetase class 2
MSGVSDNWRPTATRAMLDKRAALLARTRQFFADRGVLEVDTPMVVNAPVSDVHIHSARVYFAQAGAAPTQHSPDAQASVAAQPDASRPYFLHTSPEYAMKRLLAAGSGDIYQICHVVRGLERGRVHNAEFTLVEWYRIGFSLEQLMNEVDGLVRYLIGPDASHAVTEQITYREVFLRELQIDPLTASPGELSNAARPLGFDDPDASRDELLELLMGARIGPRLGVNGLTFVHGYPATQAALARLDPQDPRTARRFELYCDGLELANGFHELASASEQRARFEQDLLERRRAGLPTYDLDEHLLAALASGLPECAGVALGFDRTLMLATGASHIDEVLPFPIERA